MTYDFKNEVKLFMVFDILGDTERSGPLLWKVDRKRIEDVKNHILDLLLLFKILKKHFPKYIDENKVIDYIICHDLPEAITGDITKFEGIEEKEIKRVTDVAIAYLIEKFDTIFPFSKLLIAYENRVDLESKIVNMIDKVHACTTLMKYQSEKNIDMNDPGILPVLRNNSFIVKKIREGKDLADIFYEIHMPSIVITDEECSKYKISRKEANQIVEMIQNFAMEFYKQKQEGTLFAFKNDFPKDAAIYNRNVDAIYDENKA